MVTGWLPSNFYAVARVFSWLLGHWYAVARVFWVEHGTPYEPLKHPSTCIAMTWLTLNTNTSVRMQLIGCSGLFLGCSLQLLWYSMWFSSDFYAVTRVFYLFLGCSGQLLRCFIHCFDIAKWFLGCSGWLFACSRQSVLSYMTIFWSPISVYGVLKEITAVFCISFSHTQTRGVSFVLLCSWHFQMTHILNMWDWKERVRFYS